MCVSHTLEPLALHVKLLDFLIGVFACSLMLSNTVFIEGSATDSARDQSTVWSVVVLCREATFGVGAPTVAGQLGLICSRFWLSCWLSSWLLVLRLSLLLG